MFSHLESAHPATSPTLAPSLIERDETPAPVVLGGAYGGVPAVVPGVIEAEEFDTGGEGIGYSDTDPGNNGAVSASNIYIYIVYCYNVCSCCYKLYMYVYIYIF